MRKAKALAVVGVLMFATGAAAEEVFIHFEDMSPGDFVHGLGTLHPFLELAPLNTYGDLQVIQTFDDTVKVYKAPNEPAPWGGFNTNNALEDRFGDIVDSTRADFVPGETAKGFANTECSWLTGNDPIYCPQEFKITFHGRRVYTFKILMVDNGDWNPIRGQHPDATFHHVALRGYAGGVEIAVPTVIEYTTDMPNAYPDNAQIPRWCSLGFDPFVEADGCLCQQTPIGHTHMEVHAPPDSAGLDRVELHVAEWGEDVNGETRYGFDPNVAFDSLSIGFVNLVDICPKACANEFSLNPECDDCGETSQSSQPLDDPTPGCPPRDPCCGCDETLEVAILGTAEFNVRDVDVSSCRLEGVAPYFDWEYWDVSRPYVGALAEAESCTIGTDGYEDLHLVFDRVLVLQNLVNRLVDPVAGSLARLEVVCSLDNGIEFASRDIVRLID